MATCALGKHSNEHDVVQQLNELFGNVLNLDVIKRVAVSCHYDVIESSNKLLEITSFPDGKSVIKLEGRRNEIDLNPKTRIVERPAPLNVLLKDAKMSKKAVDIERTVKYVHKGYKVLIILRGVPGCGKSYLSKNLLQSTIGFDSNYKLHILSTDDFFYQNGTYQYDPTKLQDAHGWNHNRAFQALSRGFSPIIIDNTNTQMWEMKPYAMMATDYGYIIEILEPDTHWCFNEKELAKRNSHGVSRSKIKDMLERYDKNVTPQKLLSAYNLTYKLQKPPQMRLYPPLNIISSVSTNSLSTNTSLLEERNLEGNIMKSRSVSVLNLRPFESKSEPMETINLMDFNDEDTSHVKVQQYKMSSNETWDQNPVDKILMCSYDSTNENSRVLLPVHQKATNENSRVLRPVHQKATNENSRVLLPVHQKATNENSRVLLPLHKKATNENSRVLLPVHQKATDVIVVESSDEENEMLQTEKKLFGDLENAWGVNESALRSWDIVTPLKDEGNFAKFPQYSSNKPKAITREFSCNTEEEYFQLLRGNEIDTDVSFVKVLDTLNRDINRFTPKREPAVLKKSMQDKSCLTDDVFEDYDNHMAQLLNLFPAVPKSHLNYWYNKCKGDLEWTIEFLLEGREEVMSLIEENDEEVDAKTASEADSDSSNSSPAETTPSRERKIKRSRRASGEYKDIKKLIESKVDINEEHYSKHLLKVKQFKFGNGNGSADNSKPSTSTVGAEQINASNISRSSSAKSSIYKAESYMTDVGEVIIIDSDMEFDDFDGVDNTGKSEQKPEETTELNLGDSFVAQLEAKFGDPNMAYPKGFQPVVQVPITLARQLYTFYIESVFQQMETQKQVLETLINEDEEFARKLQAEDEAAALPPQAQATPTIREIMDEQAAQGVYQKEADKWKDLNPDNLAAKLTRQKLFSIFPTIDKDTLVEILYAHGNKYKDTVETLLASTRLEDVKGHPSGITEPPLRDEVIEEMKEAKKNSSTEEYVEQQEATFYREEANRYLKKRQDLYQKAQQYHQRGMTEVAQFYSGLASQQTMYFDRANSMAATAFLDEHSRRLQDFNTIDLHFLYVKEAIPALDLFLDRNINLLRLSDQKQTEYLQIITGRGKRSENGVSKIRPAAMARLRKRKIKFMQLNPGLLKVKVTKNSLVTSEILSE